MASGLTKFGNDLYTGERSVPFVRLRRIWLTIAVVLMLSAVAVPFIRGAGDFGAGFNFGIEFRGGSQFQVAGASSVDSTIATEAVHSVAPDVNVRVTTVGTDGLRVQTDQLKDDAQTQAVTEALKSAYSTDTVDDSFIGASWGADITRQALIGLGVFLAL
ncbi:MAG: secF, partial [Schumannella sp.]|nr:secF [Schumannella sp.]